MTQPFNVTVRLSAYLPGSGGLLTLEEQFEIQGVDFMDLCKILGEFNALAKKIKTERGNKR